MNGPNLLEPVEFVKAFASTMEAADSKGPVAMNARSGEPFAAASVRTRRMLLLG
jgi:hypothetical protein